MTGLAVEGTAVDIVYFSKAFDTVSHKITELQIVIEKLLMYELDKQMVRWIETGWMATCRGWWSAVQSLVESQYLEVGGPGENTGSSAV